MNRKNSKIMERVAGNCLIAFALMFSATSHSGEMTFEKIQINKRVFIYAEGEITKNSPRLFEEFIQENGPAENMTVAFNSKEGNTLAGIKLGRIIRSHSLETSVGRSGLGYQRNFAVLSESYDTCSSACALAFMGGVSRSVGGDGFIYFPSLDLEALTLRDELAGNELVSTSEIVKSLISVYLTEMEVDPTLFVAISASDGSLSPSASQYLQMGITTTEAFHNFKLKPAGDRIVASSTRPLHATNSQRVFEVEAYCYRGTPHVNFYGVVGYGLPESYANSVKKVFVFDYPRKKRTYGEEQLKLFPGQRLLATLSVDHKEALELAEGGAFIAFDTIKGSGISMSATIGRDNVSEPALKAIFEDCRSGKK